MTIIAVHQTLSEAVVIADTRLSTTDLVSKKAVVVRDVCQKMFVATGNSILCFSGNLCFGRFLVNGYLNRIRAEPDDTLWYWDNDEIEAIAQRAVQIHAEKPAHEKCVREGAWITITWMNPAPTLSIQHADKPSASTGVCPQTVTVHAYGVDPEGKSPRGDITRRELSFEVVGSGDVIRDDLSMAEWRLLANWPTTPPHGLRTRAMMWAEVASALIRKRKVDSVGGLLQVASISVAGVELLPYFRWMLVEPGYGTYVAMRFKDGYLIQEHRPTGKRLPVVSPYMIDTCGPSWQRGRHQRFDPSRELTRHSPGVIPESQALVAYSYYDPTEVHPAIIASWGAEPLEPNSFVSHQPGMLSRRAHRRLRSAMRKKWREQDRQH